MAIFGTGVVSAQFAMSFILSRITPEAESLCVGRGVGFGAIWSIWLDFAAN